MVRAILINAEIAKNKVKKSKDLGAFLLGKIRALNVAFQNRRKMQIYGLFNLVFKPYVDSG